MPRLFWHLTRGWVGQAARIPDGLEGCFHPFYSLFEVQLTQAGLDERRSPKLSLPDWFGLPKPNRFSFGVYVP